PAPPHGQAQQELTARGARRLARTKGRHRMTTSSDPRFLVLHALRVKGLASDELVAAISGLPAGDVAARLSELVEEKLVLRREGRMAGRVLTPAGKAACGGLVSS